MAIISYSVTINSTSYLIYKKGNKMLNQIFLGKGLEPQSLLLKRANRHGLIAGATGTGKTISLQILAEAFSHHGVPVFAADIKGDLSGLAKSGTNAHKLHDKLIKRAKKIGLTPYEYRKSPVIFWDIYGKKGHPVHATISEMGPLLLARLLDLNETQSGILTIAFALADAEGLLLLDLKDLRSILQYISENRSKINQTYGLVSPASIAAIQRSLLRLERAGANHFFKEPALKLSDFMKKDEKGKGYINLLDATHLVQNPKLYSTFLLWLLSELFENLPEIGDPEKPKIVFFFDESHLLFKDAPKALLEKIEQVVRLIRSKGVGVYFVTQNPMDLPETVLAQLGMRIQHALRAYTPREQKAVKAAASAFRQNPQINTIQAIAQLGVGEALVSTLDEKGAPKMVDQTLIRPPASQIGPVF